MKAGTAIVGALCTVAVLGLLSASPVLAQQQSGTGLSPAKSNCDSMTGCANNSAANVTSQDPTKPNSQLSNSPYPSDSNCVQLDSQTPCSNYSTGQVSKGNPVPQKQK